MEHFCLKIFPATTSVTALSTPRQKSAQPPSLRAQADIPEPLLLKLSSLSFSFFSFVACYLTRAAKINETDVRAYPATAGRKAPRGRTAFPTGISTSEGSPDENNIHPSKSVRKQKLKHKQEIKASIKGLQTQGLNLISLSF